MSIARTTELAKQLPNDPDLDRDPHCHFCRLMDNEGPLAETADAFAVPSVGAMVEGWTLIVPKTHVFSLAELDDEAWVPFEQFAAGVEDSIVDTWGPAVAFEHGTFASGRAAGCGVDHAHLHIVPIQADLRRLVEMVQSDVGQFQWKPSAVRPAPIPGLDYLFVRDASGTWIANRDDIPSQVMRRAIARSLGEAKWNWRDDARSRTVQSTRAKWPSAR